MRCGNGFYCVTNFDNFIRATVCMYVKIIILKKLSIQLVIVLVYDERINLFYIKCK